MYDDDSTILFLAETDDQDNTDEDRTCGIHLFSGQCDEGCFEPERDEMDDPFFSFYVY